MAEYYAVQRSSEYLAHYGVKGMRWGVRRAIETGNKDSLKKHYAKANKKLDKLMKKADVLHNYQMRKESPVLIPTGLVPLAGGVTLPIIAKASKHKMGADDYAISAFNAAAGAGMIGSGLYGAIAGSRRTKSKGHEKAVKKVNEWQQEMKKSFGETKYGKIEKNRPDYKDVYTLYEHGTLGEDSKGNPLLYRAPTISVKGSDLLRDSNSRAKKIFKKRLTDPPVTKSMSDDLVWLGVQSPSGRTYSANDVNSYLRIKNRRGRK